MGSSVAGPIVETSAGRVRGSAEAGLSVFRGVPYAAAPVGPLRWQATQPHPGWAGVRDAVEHGAISPQPRGLAHDAVLGTSGMDFSQVGEDCLNLTVWTPGADDGGRPVMVWIHGGGAVSGAGSWDIYSGDALARHGDIVVVSINYRLGPLGYLFVEDDGAGAGRANFWLDDMLMALNWIRENIAGFGGDPDNVTVAGQSGGAVSIMTMMSLPESAGLFRRVILDSPPIGKTYRTVDEARAVTARYLELLGVSSIAQARELPAQSLLAPIGVLAEELGDWNVFTPPFWKVLDGVTLTQPPMSALAAGAGLGIDVMLGWTREEHAMFCAAEPQMRAVDLARVVQRAELSFGASAAEVVAQYAVARPGATAFEVLVDLVGDERIRMGCVDLAELRARQGSPAFVYQFGWRPPAFDGMLGAAHCLDLPFFFHNFEAWGDAPMLAGSESSQREALADAMHSAWIAFVRTGDPNHDNVPAWTPYGERRTTMSFDVVTVAVDDLVGHWRRIWRKFDGVQL